MAASSIDLVVAIPTFIGSLSSLIATTVAIVLQLIIPPKRHFRHALIINLLVADFINSLNNTVSGAIAIANGRSNQNATADSSCIANAWIGQFSVQAVDFNILIISIVVLFTIRNSRPIAESSMKATVGVCVVAWIPGLITSNIGLGLHAYGYVSGNWCWIRPELLGLRYALTHGWRIAVFITTIAIYTYVYIYLRRVFGKFRMDSSSITTTTNHTATGLDVGGESSDTQHILFPTSAVSLELDDRSDRTREPMDERALDKRAPQEVSSASDDLTHPQEQNPREFVQQSSGAKKREPRVPTPPNLKRMMLMNGYPIAYIILWIPGMANRLAESAGNSPRWLRALQSSTQFVGLANSLVYALIEQKRTFRNRRQNKMTGHSRLP